MKKTLYTFLLVSIIFAACKKEDEVVTPTVVNGCTDASANNFNTNATNNDGSCTYSGCMDSTATNYNLIATEDDGLCEYGITGGKWIGTSQTYDIIITQWDSSQTNILFTMPVLETENNPDSLGIQQIKFFLNNLEVKTYTNQGLIENEGNWIEEDEGTINHSITITDDGEIIIFNVENITENNLVLSQDLDEMEYDEYDNTWMHFTGTADFSFDRDKNGFTTNNTNQRIGNTTWLNKAKLINSIKH
jgi:hypothetical protein